MIIEIHDQHVLDLFEEWCKDLDLKNAQKGISKDVAALECVMAYTFDVGYQMGFKDAKERIVH